MTTLTLATAGPWQAEGYWEGLDAATAALDGPFAALSLEALAHNVRALVDRAAGTRLRVATKSVRCRAVLDAVLATTGWRGALAATLPEALWLSATVDDVVVGYPTADRGALRALAADERARARITLMVDSVEHLDSIDAAVPGHPEFRVAIELDAALQIGPWRAGVLRSPVRRPTDLGALAARVAGRPGFRLVGVLSYEAQISGVQDARSRNGMPAMAIRAMQRRSLAELRERRSEAVATVRQFADLEFVNGGGTGSIEATASDTSVTEIAAGSGLFGSHLFDGYRSFRPAPALAFALPVVRRPGPGVATLLGGGWVSSGSRSINRDPVVAWPEGLRLTPAEGAGEVQTPVLGAAADHLGIGDRVWMRHAKAGELCERTELLHVVAATAAGPSVVGTIPTYRGEGRKLL